LACRAHAAMRRATKILYIHNSYIKLILHPEKIHLGKQSLKNLAGFLSYLQDKE